VLVANPSPYDPCGVAGRGWRPRIGGVRPVTSETAASGEQAPMDDELTLIGIDAANVPAKVGLARGHLMGATMVILEARPGSLAPGTEEVVRRWLHESTRFVLAIDAPLGWPDPLRGALPGTWQGPRSPRGLTTISSAPRTYS
jgi:hypothetical protein